MTVAIVGNETQYNNFKNLCTNADAHGFIKINDTNDLVEKVDIIFDFKYNKFLNYGTIANTVFVNSVIEQTANYGRFNGWNSFYEKAPLEVFIKNEMEENALIELGIAYTKVEDIVGMITPRVVSMIINEAYFALGENVSTKEEIDTAMKLGTNYPYGPFEWADIIGLNNVYDLLNALSTNNRYVPAPALLNEFKNI